jgi:hypothetical protein
MKKLIFILFLLFPSGMTFAVAPQLSYRFANPRIIRLSNFDHLQFDVQVKCDQAGTYMWGATVKFNFNNTTFNNTATTWLVTSVGVFSGNNSAGSVKYNATRTVTGTIPDKVYNIIFAAHSDVLPNTPNPDDFALIPTDWTTMFTVSSRLAVFTGDAIAGLDFLESGMNGATTQQYITAPSTLANYNSTNVFDSRDFLTGYTGRFYSTTYGWSQIGGGTNNVQYTDWNTAVSTSVWDGIAPIPSTGVSLTSNLRIDNPATLTIPPTGRLTVNGATDIVTPNGLTIQSDASTSGSFISGTASGTATYNRQMPVDALYHYISSPVNPTTPPTGIFYPWDEVAGNWGSATPALVCGRGYTIVGGSSVSFTGSIASSVGPLSTTSPYSDCDWTGGAGDDYSGRPFATGRNTNYGGGGWNLLGNPYTSALDVSKFIDANDGTIAVSDGSFDPNYEAVYIFDGSNYSFIGIEISGYPNASGGFGSTNIQVGQGFFVLAHCNASPFLFTPGTAGMQTHNTSVPFKSAETPWPGLKLKVIYGNDENSTLIVYNDQMTAGLDPGYDIGQLSSGQDVELYTALVKDNGVNFARQALPLANYDKNVVPVGIDSEKGGPVTFSAYMVPIQNGSFYLEDRLAGKFTDLSKDSYSVTLPAKTAGTGRFYIHASMVTGIQPQIANTGELNLRIWTSHNKLNIEGTVSNKATGGIYDMLGRKIYEVRLTGATYNTISVPSAITGVYLVKVTDGNKVAVRKVVF